MRPVEVLEIPEPHMVDLDQLEERRSWEGSLKRPSQMAEEAYPEGLEDAMKHCEPPLVLRNLGRVERHGDPTEPLPLEDSESPYGLPMEPVGGADALQFEPATPDLELGIETIRERRQMDRWLFRELPWESRFCRELKEHVSGPLWAWDPAANQEEEEP